MGLFGPSKNEIWKQFSKQINGEYIENGFLKSSRVEKRIDNWRIVLDTYTVSTGKSSTTYTRIRVPFVNIDNFYFKIYKAGFFSEIGKKFGMQDIIIGYDKFDEGFIIKGNNEKKVKQLFSKKGIRELIEKQPKINLEIKESEGIFETRLPDGVTELYFRVVGVIKDIDRLTKLFHLFGEVLNELCEIGCASRNDPEIKLK